MIALKDNLGSELVERVRGFFSETGPLSKAKNFEFRPQQQEMAARVAQALEEEQHLIAEASRNFLPAPSGANCSGWPNGRSQRAMDRSVICLSSPIQKFGRKCAAKHMSAPKRPVARIRVVFISRH